MSKFKFIDLFCGLGGFRIAMEQLGGECVFSCDNNVEVCETYKNNFKDDPFGDITEVSEKDLPEYDVMCAGFPCQPFSIAGKRMGFNDSRGTMFFEVARILKYTQPKIAFLENVSGIVSHDAGRTIKVIKNTLEEIGYVVNAKTMNAKDYGIPQNRNRWYCVAIRKDIYIKDFEFPEKVDLKYTLESIIEPKAKKEYASTQIAMTNINKFIDDFKNSDRYQGKDKYIIANEIRASKCNFRNDGISPCLTAKMGTGGNNIPVVVKYKRKLTEKECLKIMGFPENYKIKKNNMQSYKQIGNSVVVPIIQDIGKKFVDYLGGNEMERLIGSNSHGNQNELNIVEALNNKTFSMLNNNLKEFIKYIAEDNNIFVDQNTKINAKYETSVKLKQDFYVYIDGKEYSVSCKMGSGNSVHQEKCEDFVKFIKEKLAASDEICNDFRFFIWADGTLDGTGSQEKDDEGNIISRFSSREFREKYPDKAKNIQDFLNNNKRMLIERFLFVGRHNSKVDYIYHGNKNNGLWTSSEEIIRINLNTEKNNDAIHIGKMSLQSWNISRKGTSENKRGQLQVKYSQLKDDIFSLMKTNISNINNFMGDKEEFDISSRFNKNKKSHIWSILTQGIENLENVYMVKVSNRVLSNLSNKKVYPKSDTYLIRANLDKTFLLEKEFELSESDLKNIEYSYIENTGISVKLNGSKNYTIQKLTHDSFIKAFNNILDNAEFIFLALLLYSNDKEKNKNYEMMNKLNIDKKDFIFYFNKKLNKSIDFDDIKDLAEIRTVAQQYLKNSIKNNISIYNSIFTGSDWFEEPYVAHYIYLDRKLLPNSLDDFMITTGSGRSKGKFYIEIKP